MKPSPIRFRNIAALAVLGFVLTGLSGSGDFANALLVNNLGNMNALQVVTQATVPGTNINNDLNTRLSNWRSSNQAISEGDIINLSTAIPDGGPGTQPLPKFSRGLNTPVILNERGAVQITDDTVIHGFADIHGGIANYDQEGLPVGCDNCAELDQPVYIFDDVVVRGGTPGSTGALNVTGSIVGGTVGQTHQLTGNVQVIAGNVTIGGQLTTVGGPVTIDNTALNTTPSLFKGSLDIGYGDTRIFGNRLIIGPNPYNIPSGQRTAVDLSGDMNINGRLNVNSSQAGIGINANAFGYMYGIQNAGAAVATTEWASNTASCNLASDMVTMCSMSFSGLANPPKDIQTFWAPTVVNGLPSCTVKARKTNAAQANFTINAHASCWNMRGQR